jgi:hypothetical protein
MNDRELLELAAKAAGIEHGADRTESGLSLTGRDGRHIYLPKWNPLTDDGDAFRLAVELGIRIDMKADGRVVAYRHSNKPDQSVIAVESSRENRAENARRAAVRAAAAIGRQMG